MAVLVKKSFFHNCSPNFYFFQKSFAAQFSTNLAQFSTTFVFLRKQNGGANFLDIRSGVNGLTQDWAFFENTIQRPFSIDICNRLHIHLIKANKEKLDNVIPNYFVVLDYLKASNYLRFSFFMELGLFLVYQSLNQQIGYYFITCRTAISILKIHQKMWV